VIELKEINAKRMNVGFKKMQRALVSMSEQRGNFTLISKMVVEEKVLFQTQFGSKLSESAQNQHFA